MFPRGIQCHVLQDATFAAILNSLCSPQRVLRWAHLLQRVRAVCHHEVRVGGSGHLVTSLNVRPNTSQQTGTNKFDWDCILKTNKKQN